MVTRAFKLLPMPSLSVHTTTGLKAPITAEDLNKTHFVMNQMQTNTALALKPVLSNPIVTNGKTLKDVSLTAGIPNVVNHLLGQQLQGWTISRPKSFCVLWEDANQPNLSTQIVLWTYIDTITDIIVF